MNKGITSLPKYFIPMGMKNYADKIHTNLRFSWQQSSNQIQSNEFVELHGAYGMVYNESDISALLCK